MTIAAIIRDTSSISENQLDHLAKGLEKGILAVPFFSLNKVELHTFTNADTIRVRMELAKMRGYEIKAVNVSFNFNTEVAEPTGPWGKGKQHKNTATAAPVTPVSSGECQQSLGISTPFGGVTIGTTKRDERCRAEPATDINAIPLFITSNDEASLGYNLESPSRESSTISATPESAAAVRDKFLKQREPG